MPADGLWTVRLAVTRRMPHESGGEHVVIAGGIGGTDPGTAPTAVDTGSASLASGSTTESFDHDPTDWVSIRMGPTLSSLSEVASVKNVINDDLGEVRDYVVKEVCAVGQDAVLALLFVFVFCTLKLFFSVHDSRYYFY